MKRAEQITKSFPVLKSRMTTRERHARLEEIQDAIVKSVFNTDHAETLTMKDCEAHFRELAQERGLENNETVQGTLKDMEFIGREIAIARSGLSGERAVEKSLRYVNRKMTSLSNVLLSKDDDKTELDQVVITSSGILILEVKNYKSDTVITETGMVYGTNRKRCSDKSLGDQMNLKRYLLWKKLEQELGMHNIPIHIDSYVVFSHPTISVTDHYHQEKFCFTSTLPQKIEQFTSNVEYSAEDMKIIAGVIRSITEAESVYDIGFDYDHIKENFANTLLLLEAEPFYEEERGNEISGESTILESDSIFDLQHQLEQSNHNMRKYRTIATISTVALTGVLGAMLVNKFVN